MAPARHEAREGEKRREGSGQEAEALGGYRVRVWYSGFVLNWLSFRIGLFQAGYTNRHPFHVQPRVVTAVHAYGHGRLKE